LENFTAAGPGAVDTMAIAESQKMCHATDISIA
jgi:hypothetical protein